MLTFLLVKVSYSSLELIYEGYKLLSADENDGLTCQWQSLTNLLLRN